MPRLFTALELPPQVASHLASLQGGLPGARWIAPADFHVTLRFIGDVEAGLACDIHAALEEIRRPAFPVTLAGLFAFGGRKPRAIVAGVRAPAALGDLVEEQERLLRRLGLDPETRKFVPHVTLARLRGTSPRSVADYLAGNAFLPMPPFAADRFVLMTARDSVGGGPYRAEAAYPLGSARLTETISPHHRPHREGGS